MIPIEYAWALLKAGFMPMGGVSDEEREKLLIAHGIPHGDGSSREHGEDAPPNPLRHVRPHSRKGGTLPDIELPQSQSFENRTRPGIVSGQREGWGTAMHEGYVPGMDVMLTPEEAAGPGPIGEPGDISDKPLPPSVTTPMSWKRQRELGLPRPVTDDMTTAEAQEFNISQARNNPNPPEKRERLIMEQALDPDYDPAAQARELGLPEPSPIPIATSNDTVSVIMQILKQGETDPDKRMSWCEECSKRISGAEIGGFSDAGPHCKECERKLRGA